MSLWDDMEMPQHLRAEADQLDVHYRQILNGMIKAAIDDEEGLGSHTPGMTFKLVTEVIEADETGQAQLNVSYLFASALNYLVTVQKNANAYLQNPEYVKMIETIREQQTGISALDFPTPEVADEG